ncbi:ABC transporter permease [Capillibacterium thermochitinicola]|uniref:Iron ABC transporter permease n=1 Tax=Capillibacterium thermochitinicola TaxID=2699427 RepID=A0A8J6LJD8_9FIRM|nr:iron ABC transporter permease [Capillibacterium thermochitinicola]MBA2133756.1 iron ABC transporter permease [Capillibacterium thermochitinicola]
MTGVRNRPNTLSLILLVLFFLPVLAVLGQAFLRPQAWPELLAFLRSGQFRRVLAFSVSQAFWSAFFSLVLAVPGAYFFGRYEFPGKQLLRSVMVLPFMLPGILVVLAMVVFYGQNGILNTWLARLFPGRNLAFTGLYGYKGIVLAHVFYNFAFCLRMLGERWERISPKLEEASTALGAGRMITWRRVILPLLVPTIGYLGILVFLYSFLSFTVVLVLGGYLYQTFEVLIYIEYNNKLRFTHASMLAGVQMLLLAGVLALQRWTQRLAQRESGELSPLPPLQLKKYPVKTVLFLFYLAGSLLFFFMPLFFVLFRSFKKRGLPDGSWTLDNYRQLFGTSFRFVVGRELWAVVGTSLVLAVTVGLLTMVLAYILARARRQKPWGGIDLWLQLPMGISFLTFAFGLLKLVGPTLPPVFLIVWAQVFLAFPLVYALLRTARREWGEELIEAAQSLGASGWELFRTVELPLMRKALSSAFAYGAALSLGDLSAVLVLGQGKVITLSVAVYRLIGHYNFPQAIALGTIFILLAAALFSVVEVGYPGSEPGGHGEGRRQ